MAGSGPPLHKTYDEEIGSIRPGEAGQLLLAWRRLLRLLGISGFNPGDEPSPVPQLNVVTVGQSFGRLNSFLIAVASNDFWGSLNVVVVSECVSSIKWHVPLIIMLRHIVHSTICTFADD